MEWYVFRDSRDEKSIVPYNILKPSSLFYDDIKKAWSKHKKDKAGFAEDVSHIAKYYFMTKYEWEIIICSLGDNPEHEMKVDVYTQLEINWDNFIDYIWEHRKEFRTPR